MFKRILVPLDGSLLSEKALAPAFELAAVSDAEVTVMTVVEPFRSLASDPAKLARDGRQYHRVAKQAAGITLARAQVRARGFGIACDTVALDDDEPHRAIIAAAIDRTCDLIVMASHGRRGLSAFLLGSVANKILVYSKIPVLVIR